MKTILSIPLIILIFFSGISVKFAAHYCGGSVVATKVSLTGELATCSMERPSDNNSSQDTYSNKCCDDILSAYSICNNYIASSNNVDDPEQLVINTIVIPAGYLSIQEPIINTSKNVISPPGTNHSNSVALQVLCIFRI
jgi:hypothetical protein